MFERLAARFTDYLIGKGADPQNREIYAYAVESVISNAVSYGILLILAAVFNLVPQMLILFLFWLPLRSNWGGVHASTQALCLVLSALFGIGSVLLSVYFIPDILFIIVCLAACILLTYYFAPVVHPHHPVSQERLAQVKRLVRYVILIESAAVIALYFAGLSWVSSIGFYSIGFAVLFGMLGKILNARVQ